MNSITIEDERHAWRIVVQAANGYIAAEPQRDHLLAAIAAWGELLVELRETQPPEFVKEARMQAILRLLNIRSSSGE